MFTYTFQNHPFNGKICLGWYSPNQGRVRTVLKLTFHFKVEINECRLYFISLIAVFVLIPVLRVDSPQASKYEKSVLTRNVLRLLVIAEYGI